MDLQSFGDDGAKVMADEDAFLKLEKLEPEIGVWAETADDDSDDYPQSPTGCRRSWRGVGGLGGDG